MRRGGSPPPRVAELRARAGQDGLPGAQLPGPGPAPEPRPRPALASLARPQPPSPPRALLHSPAPPTSERPAGPWGLPWAGSRSCGDPGEPSRLEAPARPFPRPGHGRPRLPAVHRTTRGTRGRAPRGRRRLGPGGRPETESGTPRMLAGCAAPPGGRAWSGARGAPGVLLWGGADPDLAGLERAGGRFAPCVPNFVERLTLRPGRSEFWSHWRWVPGWHCSGAQAHVPFCPHPPAGGRGRPGP